MKLSCLRAHGLVSQRAQGLDEAERLFLEEHLTSCARCAEEAALMERMRAAVEGDRAELSPSARRRVLTRAFRAAEAPRAPAPRRGSPALVLAPLATIVAAVAALLLWPGDDAARFSPERASSEHARLSVAASVPEGAPAPEERELAAGAEMAAGDARVEALEPASVLWRPADSALDLRDGAIRVDLPPRPDRRFRVVTATFAVEVVGTAFEVDAEGVSVIRGRVRVKAGDDAEPIELAAGESWSPKTSGGDRPAPDFDARIAAARGLLAKGDAAGARRALAALLAQPLASRQRAEAKSLMAECALVEGDYAAAARAYGEVADGGDSLAAETALFAQGRAQMRAGQKAAARRTFQRYLARYPKGRFRAEAQGHLQRLGEKP
jgi:hypothetical protein